MLAAGTISFFGGRRLVMLPLIRPSAYSDKDLQELCDTLSDTENAVFVLTSLLEEKYGKIKPGKREQKAHRRMRKNWATVYRSRNPAALPCRRWPALGQGSITPPLPPVRAPCLAAAAATTSFAAK